VEGGGGVVPGGLNVHTGERVHWRTFTRDWGRSSFCDSACCVVRVPVLAPPGGLSEISAAYYPDGQQEAILAHCPEASFFHRSVGVSGGLLVL